MGDWRDFIGLPHEVGADPRVGAAADCLLLVFAVQDQLGIPHPEPEERWFDLARKGEARELYDIFFATAEIESQIADGCFTLTTRGTHKLGFGVWIEGGVLAVSERHGVMWIPEALKGWECFYRWKS